ncbi:MAG: hypothetical protein ACE37H_12765 [Phycisphaeraceae bacterium]
MAGCSENTGGSARDKGDADEVEDGTLVNNEHRQIVYDYFERLKNTDDAEAERQVVVVFADWLNEYHYKLQVNANEDGSHYVGCPHMPTATPWMDYTFRDASHIDLLPRHKTDSD